MVVGWTLQAIKKWLRGLLFLLLGILRRGVSNARRT
jgi:hypothetical protein